MPSGPNKHFPVKFMVPGIKHGCLRTLNTHLQKNWNEKVLDNLYTRLPPAAHVQALSLP